ncbi:MAG TPA: hypothetical protein VLI41_07540 [Phenylobacterium sp.]|uniref:hypothetical protein n=1 Tax=Phenylobacterium sp. TaxID=1871053 RepID=UPI002CAF7E80|nr:hypothetical protein [Phenylobacterium sp.]HSV03046.1 hypothetical protein [Phenylobacterium sp.]
MGLLDWFSSLAPSAAEIRAEVWKLGVRHRGEPLNGALQELREASVTPARAVLLRACVQQLRAR